MYVAYLVSKIKIIFCSVDVKTPSVWEGKLFGNLQKEVLIPIRF